MIEIRFHGRGGQGSVTAAEILAKAAFKDGKYVQSFPFFGVERRGAPVMAFTRIDDKPIDIRYQVYNPDYVLVLDDGLMNVVDVFSGIKENTEVIINIAEEFKGSARNTKRSFGPAQSKGPDKNGKAGHQRKPCGAYGNLKRNEAASLFQGQLLFPEGY